MKKFLTLFLLLAISFVGFADAVRKETYIYNIAESDTLRMDVYRAATDEPAPAVIFAFGGGFTGGHRDDARYVPLFEFLANNGITAISADYRTLLSNLNSGMLSSFSYMADRLMDAITCATTDYLTATGYVLAKSSELGVNPGLLFACGSSAGAITALQAEYELCKSAGGVAGFPPAFNYAGVISMAGAICSDGAPEWARTPAPMLLFHGDADSNVPFVDATVHDIGLWGSEAISKSLSEKGVNHWFHIFKGADHSVAISPMISDCGEILDFIHAVMAAKVNMVRTVETVRTDEYQTQFTLEDYIKANFR